MNEYLGLGLMMLAVAGFLVVMIVLAAKLGPKRVTTTKQLPFECGAVSVGSVGDQRFHVRYYLVAVLFILFDIEVVFMYPWAVNLMQLGWAGYLEMLAFAFLLLLCFAYVWRKGILDWNR